MEKNDRKDYLHSVEDVETFNRGNRFLVRVLYFILLRF